MPSLSIVFAPDGFKGSISATEAARELARGWRRIRDADRTVLRPMADGGEGTLEAFATATPTSRRMSIEVDGPDGRPTAAEWLLLSDGTGVIELANTSGIELLRGHRDPWRSDTRGFGQAIRAALDHGVSRLVLGIGSSSSTDGGIGMLCALGARAMDRHGNPISSGARGLSQLVTMDISEIASLPPGGVVVLSDVTNPLLGPHGAAAVFGLQKGFRQDELMRADAGLRRTSQLLDADPTAPGAGAAGGTGFALLGWGATLVPGAQEVATLIGLDRALAGAALVITGEGSYDAQSAADKAPAHVIARAGALGVPVAVVAGRVGPDAPSAGVATAVSLTELAGSAHAAVDSPRRWLRAAGEELARRVETELSSSTRPAAQALGDMPPSTTIEAPVT